LLKNITYEIICNIIIQSTWHCRHICLFFNEVNKMDSNRTNPNILPGANVQQPTNEEKPRNLRPSNSDSTHMTPTQLRLVIRNKCLFKSVSSPGDYVSQDYYEENIINNRLKSVNSIYTSPATARSIVSQNNNNDLNTARSIASQNNNDSNTARNTPSQNNNDSNTARDETASPLLSGSLLVQPSLASQRIMEETILNRLNSNSFAFTELDQSQSDISNINTSLESSSECDAMHTSTGIPKLNLTNLNLSGNTDNTTYGESIVSSNSKTSRKQNEPAQLSARSKINYPTYRSPLSARSTNTPITNSASLNTTNSPHTYKK
jgi:hypothetical protein